MSTKLSKYTKLILTVALVSGYGSSVQSQELRKEGRYYVAEITNNFVVRKGGTLRIYDIRGEVDVETWSRDEVVVTEFKKMDVYSEDEARRVLEKSGSSYQHRDGTIEIAGEHYNRDWIESKFIIRVPVEFNLDIETRSGDLTVRDLVGQVDLKTSGGEIRLADIDGEIDARTSGGDVFLVGSTKLANLKTSGGDIELEDIGGPILAKTSGGDITLGNSEDSVELSTSGGDIEIRNAGGEVKAKTSGGDIDIDNSQGRVDVHTSGGDVEFRNIGGDLEASTSGGDIEGRGIHGRAEVSTSGGSIDLKDVKGGVRAQTAGGDISVEITLADFDQDHRVDLRTHGGEITLYIPEDLPATFRAEIEITDRWEDYNIYSDFPLTSMEEEGPEGRDNRDRRRRPRSRRFLTGKGEINGGGDLIELFTTNGDIHIKKLRSR